MLGIQRNLASPSDLERIGRETKQEEEQAPCREADTGLDPGTPRSRPELKADAQPLSHLGVPMIFF